MVNHTMQIAEGQQDWGVVRGQRTTQRPGGKTGPCPVWMAGAEGVASDECLLWGSGRLEILAVTCGYEFEGCLRFEAGGDFISSGAVEYEVGVAGQVHAVV